eukprot:4551694-Alexandrium_andersonii.AAC.1
MLESSRASWQAEEFSSARGALRVQEGSPPGVAQEFPAGLGRLLEQLELAGRRFGVVPGGL